MIGDLQRVGPLLEQHRRCMPVRPRARERFYGVGDGRPLDRSMEAQRVAGEDETHPGETVRSALRRRAVELGQTGHLS